MKKILAVSLVAMMAVSTARAYIASTEYVTGAVQGVNAALTTEINKKAAASDLTALQGTVTANKTAADKIQQDLDVLEETVAGHTQDIADINAELGTMATSETVTSLTQRVTTAEGDITAIETGLTSHITTANNKYATKTELSGVKTTADAALSKIDAAQTYQTITKMALATETVADADADEYYPTEKRMMGKISQAVAGVNAGVDTNAQAIEDLGESVETALESVQGSLDTLSSGKADKSTVSDLGTRVTTAEGDITAIETSLTSHITTANNKYATKTELSGVKTTADAAATATSVSGVALGSKATMGMVDGNYVLTAKIIDDNVASYSWELIDRAY